MKKNLIYLFALIVTTFKTIPALASWKNLIVCDNDVTISFETKIPPTMSSDIKTLYKAHIKSKNIIRHLGVNQSNAGLELLESDYSSPQYSRLSFWTKGYGNGRELDIMQLDRGSLFSFEVITPQEISCAQEVCTSGCYAGDTPVWTCVDTRVTPPATIYKETAYCQVRQSK